MRGIAKRISLRLDSAEYAHLKQLSADTGLKMEPVLRRLIVGAELRPRPPDELPELLRQLSGMAVNINQIAKVANARGFVRMEDIDTDGLPKTLVSFVYDNRSLRAHEPCTVGRSPRTAYLNVIAKEIGRPPIFILQVTNFVTGVQESLATTFDEAEQILLVAEKTNAFSSCVDVLEEARRQRRPIRKTQLPPEKLRS